MTPDEWPHIRSIAKWVLPVLVGPRIARTGASERGAIGIECGSAAAEAQGSNRADLSGFNLDSRHRPGVDGSTQRSAGIRPADAAPLARGAFALPAGRPPACSRCCAAGSQWPRCPSPQTLRSDEQRAMAGAGHRAAVQRRRDRAANGRDRSGRADRIRTRKRRSAAEAAPTPETARHATGPLRIRGRVGDGLYWSLRAAGASPDVAAQYLAALATEIDVGGSGAGRQLRPGSGRPRRQSALCRARAAWRRNRLQLVRWTAGGQAKWIDAANADSPAPVVSSGMAWPVAGRITSYFGYRYHPILHFTPLPRRSRFRRQLGQPDRRRGRRPGGRRGLGRRLRPPGPDRPRRRADRRATPT